MGATAGRPALGRDERASERVSATSAGNPVPDARLLVLMGSGETTPTMASTHRRVIDALGGAPVPCVFLDTPFDFQENAEELSARSVTYFRERLRSPLAVTGLTRDGDADPYRSERLVSAVREARYVFAGPGSPSHALERWRPSPLPELLREKLIGGGAIGFSSAAALTLGTHTIPVYEIYKVGHPPTWLEGLDVLHVLGWQVAVVPHFDNAEGGTHDTRYCYLGERRLRLLESALPEDAFILGIDEHTALLCDLAADRASVMGRGGVTLRRAGESRRLASGSEIALSELATAALALGGATPPARRAAPATADAGAHEATKAFAAALAEGQARDLVGALLELESAVDRESAATATTARLALRSLLLKLEEPLAAGLADAAVTLGPFVDLLLELRARARDERRYDLADEIRERLIDLGVEVHDTPQGSTWTLTHAEARRAD